ncbi:hypothetical protein Agub_g1847 [Astrephomene gubernaculifera]|uniref:Gfd2/YDR514C-like C-terminal domain-containing protein n=1 Tax=Astrephomene gubernaculifera TaxID=47775 RepID=A0AAD3HI43_9CHLO|nr:hypothetical protein Agub_g1847 [Astrephomene gubernaculifera]
MDERLISVASLENAWARLSANPEYQRAVTTFFKAPTFYLTFSGLYAGTSKASRKRAVYCSKACGENVSRELVAHLGSLLVTQAPVVDIFAEDVEELQPLQLQSAEDVKALFKELKRVARHHRQNRQLAAAQLLLLNARRWTTPFQPNHHYACGAAQLEVSAAPGGAAVAVTREAVDVGCSGVSASCATAEEGQGHGEGGLSLLHSHPLPGSAVWDAEEGAGDGAAAAAAAVASAAAGEVLASAMTTLRVLGTSRGGADAADSVPAMGPTTPRPAAPAASSASAMEAGPGPSSAAIASQGPAGAGAVAVTAAAPLPAHPATAGAQQEGTDGSGSLSHCGGADSGDDGGGGGGSAGGGEGVLVVCCSIDLEWWERDSSRVTEIGWTMWDNLTRQLQSRHHIVSEHEALVNRIHVPDHKHDFLFGASSTGPLAEGAAALQRDLQHYGAGVWAAWCASQGQQQGPQQGGEVGCCGAAGSPLPPAPPMQLVVVGHGLSGDLKALSGLLGVVLPPGAAILDTADLTWAALGGGTGQERTAISLRLLLKTLGIPATMLHNGGNDARYTMEAALALAAIEPNPVEQ